MPISILFWVLFILFVLLVGFSLYSPPAEKSPSRWLAGFILLAAMLFILGWKTVGFIIQGG